MTPRKPTPFEEMDSPHEEDHPLDVYSRNCLTTRRTVCSSTP